MAEITRRSGPTIPKHPADTLTAGGIGTSTEDLPGGPRWRETSYALHSRLRGSIQDTLEQIQLRYGEKALEDYTPRPMGYVQWLARQFTDEVYTTEPKIDYLDPETGAALDPAMVKTITRYREAAGITPAFLAAHEEMTAPGNGVVWLMPVIRETPSGPLLGITAKSIPAHEQSVQLVDHPESQSERDVTAWRVRLPLPGGQGLFGVAEVRRGSAVWDEADGGLVNKPIWPELGGQPLSLDDDIPAIVFRWSDPDLGVFWSHAREEVLWQARAVDLGYTNAGETEATIHGQWIGEDLRDKGGQVKFGRRLIVEVEKGGSLKNEAPQPNLAGALNNLEGYVRVSVASQNADPATLLRSTAVTARGKEVELQGQAGLRRRHLRQLAKCEQRAYDLMRKWLKRMGIADLPRARLVVQYAEPVVPHDPLHEAQAAAMLLESGQENPYSLYALRKGCSLEDAKKAVDENIRINAEVRSTTAPAASDAATTTPGPDGHGSAVMDAKATAGADVQKTALNGAQVTALQGMLDAVTRKQLARESARGAILLAFPDFDPKVVDKMLDSAERFSPEPQATV